MYLGSERVWWREGQQVLTCNETVCPHAVVYEDKVVNHAPYNAFNGWSAGINGQVDGARQLAAYNFVAFLMNDENKVFLSSLGVGWFGNWSEFSLGLCGLRPLCVCCATVCLMNCLTHGKHQKHERHEQG